MYIVHAMAGVIAAAAMIPTCISPCNGWCDSCCCSHCTLYMTGVWRFAASADVGFARTKQLQQSLMQSLQ